MENMGQASELLKAMQEIMDANQAKMLAKIEADSEEMMARLEE
jgi:hypothetical protein